MWEDYVITDLGRAWPLVLPQALSAGLLEAIRLIILCLSTSYSLLRLHTLCLDLLTCTFLPLQETIMSHTNIPYYSLYLDLLTSAAPGGDYVTPMNNTHHMFCVWYLDNCTICPIFVPKPLEEEIRLILLCLSLILST